MKYKQPHLGFEIGSPCLFPTCNIILQVFVWEDWGGRARKKQNGEKGKAFQRLLKGEISTLTCTEAEVWRARNNQHAYWKGGGDKKKKKKHTEEKRRKRSKQNKTKKHTRLGLCMQSADVWLPKRKGRKSGEEKKKRKRKRKEKQRKEGSHCPVSRVCPSHTSDMLLTRQIQNYVERCTTHKTATNKKTLVATLAKLLWEGEGEVTGDNKFAALDHGQGSLQNH